MFTPPSDYAPDESVAALRYEIGDLFLLTDTTVDWPQPGHVRFRGRFLCDLASCFDELRRRFERHGFTPMIRREGGDVVLIALPTVYDPPPSRWIINLALFAITIVTTLYAGAINAPGFTGSEIWLGWPFSLSMLLILGAHELGHYFAARHHNVPVTLPYFIPFPSIIGTMGAFIRLKAPIKNKRALMDIGAAGPLAGLVFAIPILLIGLWTSDLVAVSGRATLCEGDSILYRLAKWLVFDRWLANCSGPLDVSLNQVAWAGWVGLFVTGLNLIPVGQLDGGHISYVLFGRRARRFFVPALIALIALALFTGTATWWLWVLLLFFFGRVYAEPLDDVTPLDGGRRLVAIFTLLLFFLVFVPVPLHLTGP